MARLKQFIYSRIAYGMCAGARVKSSSFGEFCLARGSMLVTLMGRANKHFVAFRHFAFLEMTEGERMQTTRKQQTLPAVLVVSTSLLP